MPSKQGNDPTYAEVMQQILNSADSSIPVKEFSEQFLALRPSKAKNPLQAIKNDPPASWVFAGLS